MHLFFLSANGILYSAEIDDDWYAAHKFFDRLDIAFGSQYHGNKSFYLADEPAAVLGCTIQNQMCNISSSSDRQCTQLGGYYDLLQSSISMGQKALDTCKWVDSSVVSLTNVVNTLRSSSLTSGYTLIGGFQSQLPNNQWQLDVENWHNITLASFQQGVVSSATGPQDPKVLETIWQRAVTKEEKYFCKNQVCWPTLPSFPVVSLLVI